jgi:hypothetical protein
MYPFLFLLFVKCRKKMLLDVLKSGRKCYKTTVFFLSPTPFFLYSVLPVLYLFHSSCLPSVFMQYFSPYPSLHLSYFATSIPHVLNCLSLLIAHSVFLSFRPIPIFSFLVSTSKSRHHFSFFCTVSPQVLSFSYYFFFIKIF